MSKAALIIKKFLLAILFLFPCASGQAEDFIKVYNDFSKGLDLKTSSFSLSEGYATVCENARLNLELGSLSKRDQQLSYGTADATEAITGMHRLYLKDGTKKLIVSHGDEIETGDDDTGAFTTILDLTSGGYKWQFVTWHDIMIGTDGYNQPVKWDGSSSSATYLGSCLAIGAEDEGNWTERQPAADEYWRSIASDSDGSNLIIGASSGRIYTSSDSGVNWIERQPAGDTDKNWYSVASDDDGSNLIVGASSGRIYTSSDSGVNWTERQPAGDMNKSWRAVASDSDGSNLVAAGSYGRIYTSSDSGVNWTERQPAGDVNKKWYSVASDDDGSNLIVGASSGRIYTSSDSGVNWTERQPAGDTDKNWYSVASDGDGSNLIVCVAPGRIYTSSDSGVNWTERQPAGDTNKSWYSVASDNDGSNLVVCFPTGRIYTSSDSGVNWRERQPAGDTDKNWRSVASDSDGSNLVSAIGNGYVYTLSDVGTRPDGIYTYKISYYTSSYEVLLDTPSNTVTVEDCDINLTMIPVAPDTYGGEDVTGRKVYRTSGGGSDYKLLSNGTIANNTAVILTDSDVDGDRGADYPAGTETKKPPKCKFILVSKNRLFLANDPTNGPSRLYYSKDSSHDIFANTTDYFNIRLNDGDEITFIKILNGILVVGKENSIQKFFNAGDTPSSDWEIGDPLSTVGCCAPYGVDVTPLGLIYPNFSGLWNFNGSHSSLISDVVTPIISGITKSDFANCWGVFHENMYYLSYTAEATGASENDRVLIFDLLSNAYTTDVLGRSVFCALNSGSDFGVLYSGSSTDGAVYAHSKTVHEMVHYRHSDFAGTWDDMRYIPVISGGDANDTVLELAWDCTIDGWLTELQTKDASINTIDDIITYIPAAIIDRPDTGGTYTSQILDLNAASFDKLYWNESIPASGGDVTFAIRSAASSGGISGASWSSEFSEPTGSDISGVTAYRYVQYRATLSTDSISYTPTLVKRNNYVVKIAYDTEGSSSESTIILNWESGEDDYGALGRTKELKKLYVYYESASSGTLNVTFENEFGDTDVFEINLIDHPDSYTEYFTNGMFVGDLIKLKISESSLNDLIIKSVMVVYSLEPLK